MEGHRGSRTLDSLEHCHGAADTSMVCRTAPHQSVCVPYGLKERSHLRGALGKRDIRIERRWRKSRQIDQLGGYVSGRMKRNAQGERAERTLTQAPADAYD